MFGGYFAIREEIRRRLAEPAPALMQVLTGPRQVGKTTLLLEAADAWGEQAIYLAADAPDASLPDWWARNWQRAIALAQRGPALLLVDEVHALPDWSRLLKTSFDEAKRLRLPLHFLLTGSSSLQVVGGARESMAGRFERLHLRQWTARDLVAGFGMSPEAAALHQVRHGAFPASVRLVREPERWRAYIRDAVIDPAIGMDILMLRPVRRPALLRQVLAVCLGHPAEVIALQKIVGSLTDAGGVATVAEYLALLEDAYLAAGLPKYAAAEVRRRATPPKLVTLSNALLGVGQDPPTPDGDPRRWGRWLENACLATALNSGHTVSYWRDRDLEVDMVVESPAGRWAVEVKGGDFTPRDLTALLTFTQRNPDFRPLVIGDEAHRMGATRAGVDFLPWQGYLLDGLPAR